MSGIFFFRVQVTRNTDGSSHPDDPLYTPIERGVVSEQITERGDRFCD
jgi:hypothetical protein